MRRRNLLAAGCAAALLASGCDFSVRHGVFNPCRVKLPPELAAHPLLAAAWADLDPARVWDAHAHMIGNGDSGSGMWFNPTMEKLWRLRLYAQRHFYMNASCVDDAPGRLDASFRQRVLDQAEAMPVGFKVLLLAFDWARDDSGAPMPDKSTFYVPDEHLARVVREHSTRLAWAASIHPYDPRALDRLDAAVAQDARAIKWLPSAQNIDPASPRCDRFFARLAALRLPLITHAGDERAVNGFGEHLGNPLLLRRALDAGVRVIVAHCASLGDGHDLDRAGAPLTPNFDLFARLMDDPSYRGRVAGDVSAVTQGNRMGVLAKLLARRDWHDRLLNGSDYPLPGVVPLISLPGLVEAGLLDPAAVEPLRRLREINVLLFEFVLKRSVAAKGERFSASVFETAPYFQRAA